jgi:hypothetical protein
MPGRELRYAILIGLMLVGVGVSAGLSGSHSAAVARWPATDAVFAVPGWSPGPEHVEHIDGYTFVSRSLKGPLSETATLTIVADQTAKLFGAGAEVPFLGSGYDVTPLPTELAPTARGLDGLVAQRADERWLVLYAYGERRGLLGNGPVGWSTAVADGVIGRDNDYFKIYLMTPISELDSRDALAAVQLANTLFPRIVGWYAS